MAELLIEIFSEEIPARMQARAASDLARLMTDAMADAGLSFGAHKTFVTPRRLVLIVDNVAKNSLATREERKGPRVDAPEKAIEGFLRSTGLSKEQLEIRADKKGETYFAIIEKSGRPAAEIIAEALEQTIRNFPWPKSMRWGASRLRWVRPLHSIIAILSDNDETTIVPFEIEGILSGDTTHGHRFMAPDAIAVANADDYRVKLTKAYVVLDPQERAERIKVDAKNAAFAMGLELVENEKLLAENAGLTEFPVVYTGAIDKQFRELPVEVVETSMAEHQKFLSLRDANTGAITGYVIIANRETADSGASIKAGNSKVLNARLADAKFFWENDLRFVKEHGLVGWSAGMDNVTFHNKLGTQAERIGRLADLAAKLAPILGGDADIARETAQIMKADLKSEMVGEFPELQGLMGRYYARATGLAPEIANACEEHYQPLGPSDSVPTVTNSIIVALADKIDLLTAFWAVDEKPTGSKDPFALRRAALGVIRLILENAGRVDLRDILALGYAGADIDDLIRFIFDRLAVYLRDQGIRHDVIDALRDRGDAADLTLFVKRARALNDLLAGADGADFQAGVKRALNILAAEEKKDGVSYELDPDITLMTDDEELSLYGALQSHEPAVARALRDEDFAKAMSVIAELRPAIDGFFDKVTVNADEPMIRRNRLVLLNRIRVIANEIADFARLEG